VIQRCQLHKGRNLDALVPKTRQAYVRAILRRAYRAASATAADDPRDVARAERLRRYGRQFARRPGETLTVLKLGLPPTLRRFFATTNCIENLIGTLRHVTRNIKRWRDGICDGGGSGSACCAPPSASGASSGMLSSAPS
jgi:transposase-like protein